jgi:hypothetical protein
MATIIADGWPERAADLRSAAGAATPAEDDQQRTATEQDHTDQ